MIVGFVGSFDTAGHHSNLGIFIMLRIGMTVYHPHGGGGWPTHDKLPFAQ
jgi:hypothetical protein